MKDNISTAFGVSPLDSSKSLVKSIKTETAIIKKINTEDKGDYEYARSNIKDLISKGTEALDNLLELAKATEHPNVYVVLSQLLKTIGDQNISLIDIQEKIKPNLEKESSGNTKIEKAVFIGSTADLLKALK